MFVYGTLKRGFPSHRFLRDADFVGYAWTRDRYALYQDEYPGVFPGEPVSRIRGEVYALDDETLQRLDLLEDHPHLYHRERAVMEMDSGVLLTAWIYFYPHASGRLFPEGEWNPPLT